MDGEKPCAPCRAANAAYHSEYRKRNPEKVRRNLVRSEAYARALGRLKALNPGLFKVLYDEEKARLGL